MKNKMNDIVAAQVRRGPQRGHPLHLGVEPSSLGRGRRPLCHPRVQRQSQRLREYLVLAALAALYLHIYLTE